MRRVSTLALLASAFALSACAGGGGADFTADTLAATNGVCAANDTRPACTGTTTTGGGTGGGGTGGGGTGGGGTTEEPAPPNSTRLTTGAKAIILEKNILKATESNPGLVDIDVLGTGESVSIRIDTKQDDAANEKWPVAKTLDEFVAGSQRDAYNMGAGTGYREYRGKNPGNQREVLQLWSFANSKIGHYHVDADGNEADYEAWYFDGNKTGAAPTGTSINYTGRFGATAKTENWTTDDLSQNEADNVWGVTGEATATANITNKKFNAKLSPETWETISKANVRNQVDANNTSSNDFYVFMNQKVYIEGDISTTGEITGNAVLSNVTDTNNDNIADNNLNVWTNDASTNPFYGAFFGTNGAEVAGVFSLDAEFGDPLGGDLPGTNNRAGYVTMSGGLHVQ